MGPTGDDHAVRLKIPARPEYIGLARLALTGVCRLTSLNPADVVDLKLAISEAANDLLGPRAAGVDSGGPVGLLRVEMELSDARLTLVVETDRPRPEFGEERELSRAIVEATVDEWEYGAGATRLVKYL